jgi:hypothetical protein
MKSRIGGKKNHSTDALNAALRPGSPEDPGSAPNKRFRVEPHSLGLRAGIDVHRLNQLLDQLDVQAFVVKRRASGKKSR